VSPLDTVILAIDTTGARGSIALVSEAGVLEEVELDSPDGFAHVLFGEIEALLAKYKAKKGSAFDLQAFHDDLLSHGTVPVSIVASEMLAE